MKNEEITFNQAVFYYTFDDTDYQVMFTSMSSGNMHIKVCKDGLEKPIYSKEEPNNYEWFPSEVVAFDLLTSLIN